MPIYDHPPPDWEQIRQIAESQYQAQMVTRILGEPVAKWTGFRLAARAPHCQIQTTISVEDLAQRWGERLWSEVVERLRCKVCGSGAERVELHHHVARWHILGDKG